MLANGAEIDSADLGLSVVGASASELDGALSTRLQGAEEQMILDRLRANAGQRKLTAQQLGISERTLRYKLQKLREAGVEDL